MTLQGLGVRKKKVLQRRYTLDDTKTPELILEALEMERVVNFTAAESQLGSNNLISCSTSKNLIRNYFNILN